MDVPTVNTYTRALRITPTLGSGSAFTIERGGRQWLVTARRLCPAGGQRPQISVMLDGQTREPVFELLDVLPANADVAVSRLEQRITSDLPLPQMQRG